MASTSNIPSSQKRWTWNPECSDASTIPLFGISWIDSLTPRIHTSTHHQKTGKQIHKKNEIQWLVLSEVPKPVTELQCIQKVWAGLIVSNFVLNSFPEHHRKLTKQKGIIITTFWRLAACSTNLVGWTQIVGWSHQSVSQRQGCRAWTTHMYITPPPTLVARTTTHQIQSRLCTRESTTWHQITSPATAYQAAPINVVPQSRLVDVQGNQQSGTRLHHQLLHTKQHQSTSFHTPICR